MAISLAATLPCLSVGRIADARQLTVPWVCVEPIASKTVDASSVADVVSALAQATGSAVLVPGRPLLSDAPQGRSLGEMSAGLAKATGGSWRSMAGQGRQVLVLAADPARLVLAEVAARGAGGLLPHREPPDEDVAALAALWHSLAAVQREAMRTTDLALADLNPEQTGLFNKSIGGRLLHAVAPEQRHGVTWRLLGGVRPELAARAPDGVWRSLDHLDDGHLAVGRGEARGQWVLSEHPEQVPADADWHTICPVAQVVLAQAQSVTLGELPERAQGIGGQGLLVTREVAARQAVISAGTWLLEDLLGALEASAVAAIRVVDRQLVLATPGHVPVSAEGAEAWLACGRDWSTAHGLVEELGPQLFVACPVGPDQVRRPVLCPFTKASAAQVEWAMDECLVAPAPGERGKEWPDGAAWHQWARRVLRANAQNIAFIGTPVLGIRCTVPGRKWPLAAFTGIPLTSSWLVWQAQEEEATAPASGGHP